MSKGISQEAIKDHYEIRILLETEAMRKACQNMNGGILKTIKEINHQGWVAKEEGNTQAYNLANQAFHMAIWEASEVKNSNLFLPCYGMVFQ